MFAFFFFLLSVSTSLAMEQASLALSIRMADKKTIEFDSALMQKLGSPSLSAQVASDIPESDFLILRNLLKALPNGDLCALTVRERLMKMPISDLAALYKTVQFFKTNKLASANKADSIIRGAFIFLADALLNNIHHFEKSLEWLNSLNLSERLKDELASYCMLKEADILKELTELCTLDTSQVRILKYELSLEETLLIHLWHSARKDGRFVHGSSTLAVLRKLFTKVKCPPFEKLLAATFDTIDFGVFIPIGNLVQPNTGFGGLMHSVSNDGSKVVIVSFQKKLVKTCVYDISLTSPFTVERSAQELGSFLEKDICFCEQSSKIVLGHNVIDWKNNKSFCVKDAVKRDCCVTPCVDSAGTKMVVAGYAKENSAPVYLVDAHTGQLITTFVGHTDHMTALAINGSFIISANKDKTIRVWNTVTKKMVTSIPVVEKICAIDWAPSGDYWLTRGIIFKIKPANKKETMPTGEVVTSEKVESDIIHIVTVYTKAGKAVTSFEMRSMLDAFFDRTGKNIILKIESQDRNFAFLRRSLVTGITTSLFEVRGATSCSISRDCTVLLCTNAQGVKTYRSKKTV